MRKTISTTIIAALLLCVAWVAKGQVTLAWNPTPGAVTNYTVLWGTNDGAYLFSASAGTQSTLAVTGLASNAVYYFVVEATASDGTQSPFSSEIIFTNGSPGVVEPGVPGVPGTNEVPNPSGTNGSTGSTGWTAPSTPNTVNTTTSEFSIQGIPPFLGLGLTNKNHPLLVISGTVGAALEIQCTTNFLNPDAWTTIKDLPITTPALNASSNTSAPSALTAAFVPAAQDYEVTNANPGPGVYFRVVMPYDYMVLADAVLSGAGFPSRLLLVRMPGVANDDLCYVTPQSGYLFYDQLHQAFIVEPSGSTIRQIATTFSGALGQNWTSASEFSYSNGMSRILATVVETEPPSSDPVASASSPAIQIDF